MSEHSTNKTDGHVKGCQLLSNVSVKYDRGHLLSDHHFRNYGSQLNEYFNAQQRHDTVTARFCKEA